MKHWFFNQVTQTVPPWNWYAGNHCARGQNEIWSVFNWMGSKNHLNIFPYQVPVWIWISPFLLKKKLTSCRILSGIWNMVDYISNYKIWWTRYQIVEPPLDKCLSFTFKLRWGGQFCFISCYRFLPGSHFNPCQSFLQFVSVDILDSDPWRISGCLKMSSSSKSEPWFH